jgi:hypothetical protein
MDGSKEEPLLRQEGCDKPLLAYIMHQLRMTHKKQSGKLSLKRGLQAKFKIDKVTNRHRSPLQGRQNKHA